MEETVRETLDTESRVQGSFKIYYDKRGDRKKDHKKRKPML